MQCARRLEPALTRPPLAPQTRPMQYQRPSALVRARDNARELWAFLRQRKKWWLVPIILALLLLALLVLTGQGTAVGPFIYTLF